MEKIVFVCKNTIINYLPHTFACKTLKKFKYSTIKIALEKEKGYSVVTTKDIPKKTLICKYAGELINKYTFQ